MNLKIFTLGDSTFDITFKDDIPLSGKTGGSAVNTAISLARLGCQVSMVTLLANDEVGKISRKFLEENGVNTSLITSCIGSSKIALAFLDENNDASYSFYEGQMAADVKLKFPTIEDNSIILFGSSFAIKEKHRSDMVEYLKDCRKKGNIIYYDPNIRPSNLKQNTLEFIYQNIEISTIIKGSEEDFGYIFNSDDSDIILKKIQQINPKAILIITSGKNPVKLFTNNSQLNFEVPLIKPISTIGAGDTFNAGVIYSLATKLHESTDIDKTTIDVWTSIIEKSIALASMVCLSQNNFINNDASSNIDLIKL